MPRPGSTGLEQLEQLGTAVVQRLTEQVVGSLDVSPSWRRALTEVGDEQYVVLRTINRLEYRRLVVLLEGQVCWWAEAIAEVCILWPKKTRAEMANEMAGVRSIILQQVMEASAFVSVQVRQH
jgi:hypothetical protein